MKVFGRLALLVYGVGVAFNLWRGGMALAALYSLSGTVDPTSVMMVLVGSFLWPIVALIG